MSEANYWTRRSRTLVSRRRMLAGGSLTGMALLAAACGSSNSGGNKNSNGRVATNSGAATNAGANTAPKAAGTSAPSGNAASGTAAAASNEGTPVSGGTLIAIQTRDAASLDPLASQVYTTPERIGLVYPRLLYYDRDVNADYADVKQIPSYITTGWEFAGDGSTLTFHLKQGVNYSKTPPVNGRELVSDDVKFSINRYMTDPMSTFAGRYVDIDSIQTPDKYTVIFKLKAPSAYVMYGLAAEPSFITPPEVLQQSGDYKQTLIGPGPFLHVSTTQGEGSTFKKNPDFVDAAHIYYDNYQFKVITDSATRQAALRTNQADHVTGGAGFTKPDWQTIVNGNKDLASYEPPVLSNIPGLWFNMNNPKWKDLRARQAISKSIDRKGYMKQFFKGDGSFVGPVPPGFGKFALSDNDMQAEPNYQYDPQAAKQLWQAAGSPATSIDMYIMPKEVFANSPDWAQFIGGGIKAALGVDSSYSTDEYSTFANKGYNNKFSDTCLYGMGLFDALDYLLAQYTPGGTRNGSGINDSQLNTMLADARATIDDNARAQKMIAVQKYINTQVLSMLYMPVERGYDVWNAKLRHYLPALRPPGEEWMTRTWKVK